MVIRRKKKIQNQNLTNLGHFFMENPLNMSKSYFSHCQNKNTLPRKCLDLDVAN
jgi:hypothetical protein